MSRVTVLLHCTSASPSQRHDTYPLFIHCMSVSFQRRGVCRTHESKYPSVVYRLLSFSIHKRRGVRRTLRYLLATSLLNDEGYGCSVIGYVASQRQGTYTLSDTVSHSSPQHTSQRRGMCRTPPDDESKYLLVVYRPLSTHISTTRYVPRLVVYRMLLLNDEVCANDEVR
jgi:hypothetical protein